MRKIEACLYVRSGDRTTLERLVADGISPQKLATRARIVLLSGRGLGTSAIQRKAQVSKPTVWRWQEAYMEGGVRHPRHLRQLQDPQDQKGASRQTEGAATAGLGMAQAPCTMTSAFSASKIGDFPTWHRVIIRIARSAASEVSPTRVLGIHGPRPTPMRSSTPPAAGEG
jgi:Homeodomain-like domain